MRISDWSSDVCSSDLVDVGHQPVEPVGHGVEAKAEILDAPGQVGKLALQVVELDLHVSGGGRRCAPGRGGRRGTAVDLPLQVGEFPLQALSLDRKGVAVGKRVAVSVELGCRRIMKTKKKQKV